MKNRIIETDASVRIETNEIPSYASKSIAQEALNAIHYAWEDPQIREDYFRWKAERQKRLASTNPH